VSKQNKQNKRDKRDDDDGYDLVDPIKFAIGIVKLIFNMIKMIFSFIKQLHDGLMSPHWHIRVGSAMIICFIIALIGGWIYASNPDIHREFTEWLKQIQCENDR